MNRQLSLAIPGALASVALGFAQTAPTPAAPGAAADRDVVRLSAFEVTAGNTEGYAASESISGTRIRAQIKELPFNINVVTAEFIRDFDKFEMGDALAFTSSVSSNDITPSAVNLRGFSASSPLRNGMSFFGLMTRSNLDRVEVIKGAYAAIYGKTLPGGLINIITKKPSARPRQELELTAGTLDYYRAEVSSTGPVLGDRLLYRVDLGHNEKGGSQDFKQSYRDEYSAALSYRLTDRTTALLEVTRLDDYASRPSPVVYLRDPVTNQYTGKMTDRFYFNRSGPSGKDRVHQDWDNDNVYAYVDHKFDDVWSARLSGVWWDRSSPALAMGGNTFVYTNSRVITGLNPNISDIARDNLQLLADVLAQYRAAGMGHKTLVSLTRSRESESTWTRNMSAADLANPAIITRDLNIDNPRWFYPRMSERSRYAVLARDRTQETTTEAAFFSHRADLLDGRLKAFAGGRQDRVTNELADRLTNLRQRTTASAFTPQGGFNWTPVAPVSLYASYSEAYLPQSQVRTNTQELYPNEEGVGYEAGVKTVWLGGKLSVTAGVYSVERNNVLQTYADEQLGIAVTDVSGQIVSDGVEIDFNWQPGERWQVMGAYGYSDTRVTKNPEAPQVVGLPPARGPAPYNYGLALIHRVRGGPLAGLTLRADVSGQGRAIGEYGSGPYTRGGIRYPHDGRQAIWKPAFTVINAGASYAIRARTGRWRHHVSLNLKNLADRQYAIGNWIPADGFSVSLGYSLRN